MLRIHQAAGQTTPQTPAPSEEPLRVGNKARAEGTVRAPGKGKKPLPEGKAQEFHGIE